MKPTAVLSPRPDVEPGAPHRPDSTPSTLDHLDDTALLHLLLPPRNSRTVAADLLARFGSLGEVMAADRAELVRMPDVTEAVITTLKGLRELCVRSARHTARRRPVLTSWSAVRDYAVTALAHLPREQFRALYLDRRNILNVARSDSVSTITATAFGSRTEEAVEALDGVARERLDKRRAAWQASGQTCLAWVCDLAHGEKMALLAPRAGAMELVARELKALGLYVARSLSFEGVEYDPLVHPLTPDDVEIWDAWAEAFQLIHAHLAEALKAVGISDDEGTVKHRRRASRVAPGQLGFDF